MNYVSYIAAAKATDDVAVVVVRVVDVGGLVL